MMSITINLNNAKALVDDVIQLMSNNKVKHEVKERLKEFLLIKNSNEKRWFLELCFCILAANFNAQRAWYLANRLFETGIIFNGTIEQIAQLLRNGGHRFWKIRSSYIAEAKKYLGKLKSTILSMRPEIARKWLVKNIKGIGLKEASHFLRNVGVSFEFAILDRHILRTLANYKIISFIPKRLSKRIYLEIEKTFRKISRMLSITPAELDLYLWYMQTGIVFR